MSDLLKKALTTSRDKRLRQEDRDAELAAAASSPATSVTVTSLTATSMTGTWPTTTASAAGPSTIAPAMLHLSVANVDLHLSQRWDTTETRRAAEQAARDLSASPATMPPTTPEIHATPLNNNNGATTSHGTQASTGQANGNAQRRKRPRGSYKWPDDDPEEQARMARRAMNQAKCRVLEQQMDALHRALTNHTVNTVTPPSVVSQPTHPIHSNQPCANTSAVGMSLNFNPSFTAQPGVSGPAFFPSPSIGLEEEQRRRRRGSERWSQDREIREIQEGLHAIISRCENRPFNTTRPPSVSSQTGYPLHSVNQFLMNAAALGMSRNLSSSNTPQVDVWEQALGANPSFGLENAFAFSRSGTSTPDSPRGYTPGVPVGFPNGSLSPSPYLDPSVPNRRWVSPSVSSATSSLQVSGLTALSPMAANNVSPFANPVNGLGQDSNLTGLSPMAANNLSPNANSFNGLGQASNITAGGLSPMAANHWNNITPNATPVNGFEADPYPTALFSTPVNPGNNIMPNATPINSQQNAIPSATSSMAANNTLPSDAQPHIPLGHILQFNCFGQPLIRDPNRPGPFGIPVDIPRRDNNIPFGGISRLGDVEPLVRHPNQVRGVGSPAPSSMPGHNQQSSVQGLPHPSNSLGAGVLRGQGTGRQPRGGQRPRGGQQPQGR